MRALAVVGIGAPGMLTDWQDRAYRGTALPCLPEVQHVSQYRPVDVVDDSIGAEDLDPDMREDLHKLFSRIPPSAGALRGDSSL